MNERSGPVRQDSTVESNHADIRTTNGAPKWWQRKRIIIPVLILILGAIAVFYYWDTYVKGYDTTDDATIDANSVTISSKVLGRIVELGAGEGDTVQQDQLLVRLDDSDLKAQEAQSKANLDYAQKNSLLAQVNLQKAQDDFNRAEIQIKGNAITREQYDHARQAVETAQAQSNASQSQIGSSQAQLVVVQTQLTNTEIKSPFKGVVARRWLLPGDVVQPAQPILTVYDLQETWVTAYFEETKIQGIRLDDPVDISVDGYPDIKFTGNVSEIGATAASEFSLIPANNASGNFTKVTQRIPIKITFHKQYLENKTTPLRAGMSVEVRVDVRGR
jgi:membrane fusion protein, multidrug efflux system